MSFLRALFDTSFMPHGHCYLWEPSILWTHAVSDGLIALAYYTIPFLLFYVARKRRDLAYPWMFVMFGAFILLCGTTHVLDIYSIWNGAYRLTGAVKAATAVVSVATAASLVPLVPRVLTLVGPGQLQRVNDALSEANAALRDEIAAREAAEQELRAEIAAREAAEQEQRGLNAQLASLNGELRTLNAALATARDTAEAATSAKSQYLAVMSHEIRTPLNAVVGFGQLLKMTPLSSAQAGFVQHITDSSETLLRLINDILDLSKIEASGLDLERAPLDVRALVDTVRQSFAVQAEGQGVALEAHVAPDVPALLVGDAHRLRQVLTNYVGNALKFTTAGTVAVSAEVEAADGAAGPLLHLRVRDTGIGLAPEQMDRLFKAFSQADASTTRRFGGTGLGLAIVKRLAHLMGGEAWAESVEGEGSTFHFTARMGVAQPAAAAAAPVFQSRSSIAPDLKVLMAEDIESNQAFAQAALKLVGLHADVVTDGAQAVEALEAAWKAGAPYDVVLMDLQMPTMGGLEATERLRARLPSQAQPYVVALTANAFRDEEEACLQAGMDDFIAKPFRPQRLNEVLAEASRQRPGARRGS